MVGHLRRHRVRHLLIGGVNYLLQHKPVLTFDVDFWVRNDSGNLARCEKALAAMGASWGTTDREWALVSKRKPGWLSGRTVFCMTSPLGSLDIFLCVKGLDDWDASAARSVWLRTDTGMRCRGICDRDMLACQLALPAPDRKLDRVRDLRSAIRGHRR